MFLLLIPLFLILQKMLTFDPHTEAHLSKLEPIFRLRCRAWLMLVKSELGLDVYITSSTRTPAEQLRLHHANPQNPAAIGDHDGHAVDVNFRKNGVGVLLKVSSDGLWAPVVRLAKLCGLAWGGHFKTYKDRVHFYARS